MLAQMKQAVKRVPALATAMGSAQRQLNTVLARFPLKGEAPSFETREHLAVGKFSSMEDYIRSGEMEGAADRAAFELTLTPEAPRSFEIAGHCAICNQDTSFACDFAYARQGDHGMLPNWRESLLCRGCGFRNRVRGALHVLLQEYRPGAEDRIYLSEQLTRVYRWMKGRFRNIIGSEYVSDSSAPGSERLGIRHEDLQQLSFPDASFDFVLSFDVLEHVPYVESAFAEMRRVLRPGGRLFFTAPMVLTYSDTLTRAVLRADGSINHLEPPEYHGNPSNPAKGALCFRHFGWRVLDDLRDAGFAEAQVLTWWDDKLGYLQYPQYAVTAVRAG